MISEKEQSVKKPTSKNKGGRPKKAIKRDQQLATMCSVTERIIIEYKAKKSGCSTSQFLRELALRGQVVSKTKAIPKDFSSMISTLNHMAANLNQLAKKNNRGDSLNASEKIQLNEMADDLKKFIQNIKNSIQ